MQPLRHARPTMRRSLERGCPPWCGSLWAEGVARPFGVDVVKPCDAPGRGYSPPRRHCSRSAVPPSPCLFFFLLLLPPPPPPPPALPFLRILLLGLSVPGSSPPIFLLLPLCGSSSSGYPRLALPSFLLLFLLLSPGVRCQCSLTLSASATLRSEAHTSQYYYY